MKKTYTEQNTESFFEGFKKIKNSYTIEKVHHLLNTPDAKATQKVNFHSKRFKITIMTSVFIIGLFSILLNYPDRKQNAEEITPNNFSHTETTDNYASKGTLKQIPNQEYSESNDAIGNTEKTSSEQVVDDNAESIDILEKEPLQGELYFTKASENDTIDEKKELVNNQNSNSETNDGDEVDIITILPDLKKTEIISKLNWPEDTVLVGKSLLVTLTRDELLSIGIIKTNDTTYQTKDPIFQRVYNCEVDFGKHSFKERHNYESLDTLLPIIVKNVSKLEPESNRIWWYATNKDLFKALPKRYKYLEDYYTELKYLKRRNAEHTYVNYFNSNDLIRSLEQLNVLNFAEDELKELGFEFKQDSILIQDILGENSNSHAHEALKRYDDNELIYRKEVILRGTEKENVISALFYKNGDILNKSYGSSIGFSSYEHWNKAVNPIPIFISDAQGRIYRTYMNDNSELDYNTLIPIKINFEQFNFEELNRKKKEHILWYEADEEFLSHLPLEVSKEIQREYDIIKNESEETESSCTYFEVCKSTLRLNNFKLYPNPATNKINIEFYSEEDLFGNISIVNIAGARLRTLIANTKFASGTNNYQTDISDITPGLYLISIETNKGFITQRLIISQ